jgi:hypothetical protein
MPETKDTMEEELKTMTRTDRIYKAPIRMRPSKADMEPFDGKEVTEFLDEYNRQANNSLLTESQKVHLLPDYVDHVRRSFIKKMRAYTAVDWTQLQIDMKEHWRDNDTSQQRGTRAYLEAYIRLCSQSFPGISDYYTNFLVTSDAGIASKQVHETERGYLFFKGLPRADKELVLFHMPEPRPRGIEVSTYDMEAIYKFVRTSYRQREGIKQTSFTQAEEDARRAQQTIRETYSLTTNEIQSVVKDLKHRRDAEKMSTVPAGVDPEVQNLIDAMKGIKISAAEVKELEAHPAIGPLLREGRNYVYFLTQVTRQPMDNAGSSSQYQGYPTTIMTRNDGSFVTDQPRNVDPYKGTGLYKGREVRTTCNGCGEEGHFIRDCEYYLNLIKLGWISFDFDRETKRTTWFYGPRHKRLGEIADRPPPTLQLSWIQGKIRDFFEVTNDVLDTPASACKPELFDGMDSRPEINKRKPYQTTGVKPVQGNTVTIKRTGDGDPAAHIDLAEFHTARMLTDNEDQEIITLDQIDARDIVLGSSSQANTIAAANAAARTREQPVDKVLDQVRQNQLQKKRGRPKKTVDVSRLNPHDLESTAEPGMSDEDDSQTLPFPSQAHDHPFAVIKPSTTFDSKGRPLEEPRSLKTSAKKKVRFKTLDKEALHQLLKHHPNRIPTAMLKQEVRGVTIGDFLSHPAIKAHFEELMSVERSDQSTSSGEVNSVEMQRLIRESGAKDPRNQSRVVGSRLAHPTTADWLKPELASLPNADRNVTTRPTPDGWVTIEETTKCPQVNLAGQARHSIAGTWDTWNTSTDYTSHRNQHVQNKSNGLAFVQSELPTCWATVGTHAIRCLIDTGAQMNLLRQSAAFALKIPFEAYDEEGPHRPGVVSANGSTEPFLGTAWYVPIKIGQVVTTTHFRIIANLTRSAILGAPWCASARLSLQYNVYGRVTCRILDSTGSRNAMFIASDPAPNHPRHVEEIDEDEDSEN